MVGLRPATDRLFIHEENVGGLPVTVAFGHQQQRMVALPLVTIEFLVFVTSCNLKEIWFPQHCASFNPERCSTRQLYSVSIGSINLSGRSITRSAYSPGIVTARGIGRSPRNTAFLTRLTFITSDGSVHELRDQLTGGKVQKNGAGFSRGRVFVAADGSGLSFISDTDIIERRRQDIAAPTGYLLTKSGARYRVVNGFIRWVRDRNGNILNFSYDNFDLNGQSFYGVKSITDSLN